MTGPEGASVPALLDYDGAALLLGCTPRMVRKLVETRQLDSVKVGRLVRVEPEAITRYIERHRRPAVTDLALGWPPENAA
jgi:excisionase family DNA binding protein